MDFRTEATDLDRPEREAPGASELLEVGGSRSHGEAGAFTHGPVRAVAPAAVLQSLLDITETLTADLDTEKTYDAILRVVRRITGAERVSIQLLDASAAGQASSVTLVAALGLPSSARIGGRQPLGEGVASCVLAHGRPLLLNGTTHADPDVQRLLGRLPGRSALCVPLNVKGQTLGVLNASKPSAPEPFDEADRDFLAVLAGQAAIALDRAQLYSHLQQLATLDSLTGLLNHATFQTRMTEEVDRASRRGEQLALLHIDLDGFKMVNDTYGHTIGDQLLKLMVEHAIGASIRQYDIPCRVGGDEFALILPNSTAEQAWRIAERIRLAIAICPTERAGVPTGRVTASIGLAHFPSDGVRREDLVEAANEALESAKYLGRNRVERGSSAILRFERDPRRLHDLLADANVSTIEVLAAAIDARDAYTAGHSRRVAEHAGRLAEALGYDQAFQNDLRLACLVHDVGKIGVPDAILRKPDKLSEEEFAQMRLHARLGAEMLSHVPSLQRIVSGIRYHHERWDGRGYPDGLSGEQIPEMARIIAIADAYDAMTSNRVYRNALSLDKVMRILSEGAGTQWDAQMVDAWLRIVCADEVARQADAPHGGLPIGLHREVAADRAASAAGFAGAPLPLVPPIAIAAPPVFAAV